jgi:hypothetical protein
MKRKPRGKSFGSPDHPHAGNGRIPGTGTKLKLEITAWLKTIAEDEEWRAGLLARARAGDTILDREIIARAAGKVPDVLHLETPAPLVIDLIAGPRKPDDDEPAE